MDCYELDNTKYTSGKATRECTANCGGGKCSEEWDFSECELACTDPKPEESQPCSALGASYSCGGTQTQTVTCVGGKWQEGGWTGTCIAAEETSTITKSCYLLYIEGNGPYYTEGTAQCIESVCGECERWNLSSCKKCTWTEPYNDCTYFARKVGMNICDQVSKCEASESPAAVCSYSDAENNKICKVYRNDNSGVSDLIGCECQTGPNFYPY
jgi:hypothetical protein